MNEQLTIKRYLPEHPLVKEAVSHFWQIKSSDSILYKYHMLPGNAVDLILNLSVSENSSSFFSKNPDDSLYICGINETLQDIDLKGNLDIVGVSFRPGFAFSWVKTPVSEIKGLELLDQVSRGFPGKIFDRIVSEKSINERFRLVEQGLAEMLDPDNFPQSEILYSSFALRNASVSIDEYCGATGIHRRKLERDFKKYLGTSPKRYQQLHRVQNAMEKLYLDEYDDLSFLAGDCGYFDQAHFNHEFKSFTGFSPGRFNTEINDFTGSSLPALSALSIYSSPLSSAPAE